LVAAIPWLFCPAVFGPEGKFKPLRAPLSLLPFLAIVLFFQVSDRFGLYPVPINLKLHGAEMAGLLAPLVAAKRDMTLVGFYHIPVAPLLMGLSMLLAPLVGLRKGGVLQRGRFLKGLVTRRFGIIAIFVVATILSFHDSFLEISPVIWLAVSVLCWAVLIGAGMQGLISAGYSDRKWILFTAIVMGVFAIVTLLLATKYFQTFAGLGSGYARLLTEEAKMYILGAITVAIFFFMTRHASPCTRSGTGSSPLGMKGLHPERSRRVPVHLLKAGMLCVTMGLDIFLGARFVVDRIL